MGSDLKPRGDAIAPTFVANALADPGVADHPGGLLQRLQIIKVTTDAKGQATQSVIDIAGGPNDAGVDEATCEPRGAGAASLCATWKDPDFDPLERAAYYARVVENPSCRAYTRACANLSGEKRPPSCDDPTMRRYAQERAWSSPIWFSPHPN
jgi:hypothetical protein